LLSFARNDAGIATSRCWLDGLFQVAVAPLGGTATANGTNTLATAKEAAFISSDNSLSATRRRDPARPEWLQQLRFARLYGIMQWVAKCHSIFSIASW